MRSFLTLITLLFFSLFFLSLLAPDRLKATIGEDNPQSSQPRKISRTTSGQVDLCLSCHEEKTDKAHARDVLGCSICHMGNPLTLDKKLAHYKMVLNPGELKFAERTCGQAGCHENQVKWVKNSLMATNRGIISTLRYYWKEHPDINDTLTVKTLKDTGLNSPALDYYRKLCGTCHLWMERRTFPSFLAEKGGGCTACHLKKPEEELAQKKRHPLITRDIPMENCIRCHNRSGRIGLSYQGKLESEGYGTPFHGGDFTDHELIDGRFYNPLPEDVHHKAGLICIDCHTQKEVMGDGTQHAHMQDQLEIKCASCHGDEKTLSENARLNAESAALLTPPGATGKQNSDIPRITGIKKENGRFFLTGKADKKAHPLDPPDPIQCKNSAHRRLSCQACHATWVPQCYGCHVKRDGSKSQLDKISIKETPGQWKEFRSFIRYEVPPLGILEKPATHEPDRSDRYRKKETDDGEVVILVPG